MTHTGFKRKISSIFDAVKIGYSRIICDYKKADVLTPTKFHQPVTAKENLQYRIFELENHFLLICFNYSILLSEEFK